MSDSDFDVFISYARKDNVPDPETGIGWVSAIRDVLEQDAREFGSSIRIFMDTSEIQFMEEWEQRIRGALRSSKVLLICASPNYFASKPCRWEWDEFLLRRERLLSVMGRNGVVDGPLASVFFVETPESDDVEVENWKQEVNRIHRLDLLEWFPHGSRQLQREEVRSQLRAMGDRVADRVRRARVIELAEGNVRASTEYFVGRVEPMRKVREAVFGPAGIGVVTAIHAMGGIGKTELAVTYANQNREHYTGGVWFLEAEQYTELLPLLATLGQDPRFGWEPPRDAEVTQVGLGVLAELQRRAREVGPTLLIVDNLSEARLLSPSVLAPLRLGQAQGLAVIATTRLGPEQFAASRSSVSFVELGTLSLAEGVELVENHQPGERFPSPEYRSVVREIVELLEGLTLAIEQVAIYLGMGASPDRVLTRLREAGVGASDELLDADSADVDGMQHQHKTMAAVLDTTLSDLDEVTMMALMLAGHLPAETIPLDWLREMLTELFPDEFASEFVAERRWLAVTRALNGRRLLLSTSEPHVMRMHRVVGEYARARDVDRAAEQRVRDHVLAQVPLVNQSSRLSVPECSALVDVTTQILRADPDRAPQLNYGNFFVRVADFLVDRRVHELAAEILNYYETINSRQGAADRDAQRELSVALSNVAQLVAPVRPGEALELFQRALGIREGLASGEGAANRGAQRDLSVALTNVARMVEPVRPGEALELYRRSLGICDGLASGEGASDRGAQRDLSVALTNVARMVALVRPGEALELYRRALGICEGLASGEGAANRGAQRDLSVALDNVAGLVALVRPSEALELYRRALVICEGLASGEGASDRGAQRDLSIALDNVARMVEPVRPSEALELHRRSLGICEGLASGEGASDRGAQRDLSIALDNVAGLVEPVRPGEALELFQRSLGIREGLASGEGAADRGAQRDLSVALTNVAGLVALVRPSEALELYRRALGICEGLASGEGASDRGAQRDLSLALTNVARMVAPVRPSEALELYRRSLGIREGLASGEGASDRDAQRDLSIALTNVARMVEPVRPSEALELYQRSLGICEGLASGEGAANRDAQRDLSIALNNVARMVAPVRPGEALELYQRSLGIREGLASGEGAANRGAQRDLSVALTNVARMVAPVRPGEALELYRRSLGICEGLASGEGAANRDAQRDLSIALNSVARMVEPVRPGEALELYQRSLGICEGLASGEGAANRGAQRDLSVALDNVARLVAPVRPGEALELYQRSAAIGEELLVGSSGDVQLCAELMRTTFRAASLEFEQTGADPQKLLDRSQRCAELARFVAEELHPAVGPWKEYQAALSLQERVAQVHLPDALPAIAEERARVSAVISELEDEE
ncbi:TIR domain-containing protein [Dietzia maris]|uniref:TIR domain-containing protein n=1 Tax=Dietzia maris TaxID=37915 RepID=UPI003443CA8A